MTLQFLLQQAAWLYDRQLSQVRAQMRKVPTAQSASPSPAPGSVSGSTALSSQPQKGGAAAGINPLQAVYRSKTNPKCPVPRGPSRQVSQQKDIPQRGRYLARHLLWGHSRYPIDNADIISGLGGRRASSTTSTPTVNQFRSSRAVSRNETPTGESKDQRWENFVRRPSAGRRDQPPAGSFLRSPPLEEEDITSSSEESESEEDDSSHRAPPFGRFGKFSTQRVGLRDDEDDEDDTPAFLPMSREAEQAPAPRTGAELSATLKQDAERAAAARQRLTGDSSSPGPVPTESPTSSISSGPPVHRPQAANRRTETLSPHRAGQAPRLSPRKSEASGREASDGTPSMGSSFSDLDGEGFDHSVLVSC